MIGRLRASMAVAVGVLFAASLGVGWPPDKALAQQNTPIVPWGTFFGPADPSVPARAPFTGFLKRDWPTATSWSIPHPLIVCQRESGPCHVHDAAYTDIENRMATTFDWFRDQGLPAPTALGPIVPRDGRDRLLLLSVDRPTGALATFTCEPRQSGSMESQRRAMIQFYFRPMLENPESVFGPGLFTYVTAHELAHTLQHSVAFPRHIAADPAFCLTDAKTRGALRRLRDPAGFAYVRRDYGWVEEGMADYLAFRALEDLKVQPTPVTMAFPAWESYYGLKEYYLGLFGPHWESGYVPGYRASSFFKHLEQRHLKSPRAVFNAFYPAAAPLPWARENAALWLSTILKTQIPDVPPNIVLADFFTDFASWAWDPNRVSPRISKLLGYLDVAFGRCQRVRLTPGHPTSVTFPEVYPYGAQCLVLDIDTAGARAFLGASVSATYQVRAIARNRDLRLRVDGLQLGRAVAEPRGGAIGPARLASCFARLDAGRDPSTNAMPSCQANRDGPWVVQLPGGDAEEVRWTLNPVAADLDGNRDVLILTYAPVTLLKNLSDDFRKAIEKVTEPTPRVTLWLDVAVTEEVSFRTRDEADPPAPEPARTPLRFVRITPNSSQFSGAAYGTLLFADDARADVFGAFHRSVWGEGFEERTGRSLFETAREVFASEFSGPDVVTDDADLDALRARRAELDQVRGFHVDILEGEARGGEVVGVFRRVNSQQWVLTPPAGRVRVTWDDLATGARFKAAINPATVATYGTLGDLPRGGDWGNGHVTVVARDDDNMTVRFDGQVCRHADTRITVVNGAMQDLACDRWQDVQAQGQFSFLETHRRPPRNPDDVEPSPTQEYYYDRFANSPVIQAMRAEAAGELVPVPEPGQPPGTLVPGSGPKGGGAAPVAGDCDCSCDGGEALGATIVDGMPDAAQLRCLDRCCPTFNQCPGSNRPGLATVQGLCF